MKRLLPLAAAATVAVVSGSARADVRLTGVDASGQPTVQLSVVTGTPSSRPPALRENGRPVVGVQRQNLGHEKSVVLAIDDSQSMRGAALANAREAARDFIAHKGEADRVAVVTFGHEATQVTRFSAATIDTDSALRNLAVDTRSGTALYDAVRIASLALSTEPNPGRVIVVLTDGTNVAKRTTLEQATRAAQSAGAAVYSIGIESADFSPSALERIARATGGRYYGAASSAALADAYDAIAAELARTWRVSYLTAARPGQHVEVAAAVPGQGSAKAKVTLPGDASATRASGPPRFVPRVLYVKGVGPFVLSLIVGGAILIAAALALATPGSTRLRRRIAPHLGEKRRARRKGVRERFGAASGVLKTTEQAFARFKFWHKLHAMLERADMPLRTVEFFYCMVIPAFVLGLLAAVSGASSLVILLCMGFGALAPLGFLWFKARRRINAIENQLPDLLITMAASLKAGHSFRQAIQAVVNEGQPPVSDEFKRVLTEAQLGRPMDDALNEMAERVQSKNLSFVLTAVTIQRQVGGSLAGIFDMVADAVRQRQAFARKIRSLTAMGRASAYTLIGIPFVLTLAITVIRPEYMEPLYSTSIGHKLIFTGIVMMVIGSWFLRKIASFRG